MPDRESDVQGSNRLGRELSASWITNTQTLLADRTGQWCETSSSVAEQGWPMGCRERMSSVRFVATIRSLSKANLKPVRMLKGKKKSRER